MYERDDTVLPFTAEQKQKIGDVLKNMATGATKVYVKYVKPQMPTLMLRQTFNVHNQPPPLPEAGHAAFFGVSLVRFDHSLPAEYEAYVDHWNGKSAQHWSTQNNTAYVCRDTICL